MNDKQDTGFKYKGLTPKRGRVLRWLAGECDKPKCDHRVMIWLVGRGYVEIVDDRPGLTAKGREAARKLKGGGP